MPAFFKVPSDMSPGVARAKQGFFRPDDVFPWMPRGNGDNPSLKLSPMNQDALELLEDLREEKLKASEADFKKKTKAGVKEPIRIEVPEVREIPPGAGFHPMIQEAEHYAKQAAENKEKAEKKAAELEKLEAERDAGASQTLREASGEQRSRGASGRFAPASEVADPVPTTGSTTEDPPPEGEPGQDEAYPFHGPGGRASDSR